MSFAALCPESPPEWRGSDLRYAGEMSRDASSVTSLHRYAVAVYRHILPPSNWQRSHRSTPGSSVPDACRATSPRILQGSLQSALKGESPLFLARHLLVAADQLSPPKDP